MIGRRYRKLDEGQSQRRRFAFEGKDVPIHRRGLLQPCRDQWFRDPTERDREKQAKEARASACTWTVLSSDGHGGTTRKTKVYAYSMRDRFENAQHCTRPLLDRHKRCECSFGRRVKR